MLACMQSLWDEPEKNDQIFDNEQKQAFSVFEMEEEQNATVHVLVLVLELMLSFHLMILAEQQKLTKYVDRIISTINPISPF